ncbi:MAG: hypothetical protein GX020_08350 [Firmicutes bacterium]|nr:hypothetical protein [Bacillota bacterium]
MKKVLTSSMICLAIVFIVSSIALAEPITFAYPILMFLEKKVDNIYAKVVFTDHGPEVFKLEADFYFGEDTIITQFKARQFDEWVEDETFRLQSNFGFMEKVIRSTEAKKSFYQTTKLEW